MAIHKHWKIKPSIGRYKKPHIQKPRSITLTSVGGTTQQGTGNPGVSWNFLLQVIQELTRSGAMLDLVLTNKQGLVGNVKVKRSLVCSDHKMVEFKIRRAARRVRSKLATLDFRRADFGLLKDLPGRIPWDKALEGRGAQESWSVFKDHLLQAQEGCIPTKGKSGRNARRPTWMNKELLAKLKQ